MNSPNAGSRPRPVICVVGARPNFMKMAPILRAFSENVPPIPAILVHTGQHYDADLNDRIFHDLGLPKPQVNLGVGSGSHTVQTAEVMRRFEPLLEQYRPSCVVVVGDVNSTLACTLVAVKQRVRVAHIEAGLRSFDRTMPEEINRLLTDQVADRLYTTERSAHDNLAREGIGAERVCFVGNVMIDSLMAHRATAPSASETLLQAGVDPQRLGSGSYGVVTLHRPSNVDSQQVLSELLGILVEASRRLPLVFAMHPRTRSNAERFGLLGALANESVIVLPPQGYLQMLGLMAGAAMVLSDSGGLQEETTALGIPCLTLRENTERPITVSEGTNTLVGRDRVAILHGVDEILAGGGKRGRIPEFWDGQTAGRIAADMAAWLKD